MSTDLIPSPAPAVLPAALFAPTPKAAKRVIEFFTTQISNHQGRRGWVRLHEKGGKEHEVPCHHSLEQYLEDYIAAAGIAGDLDGPLFRTAAGKTGALTGNAMWQQDALRMIQRRAEAAGIEARIGNHTFRATGITAYLQNKGTLETAQQHANHESPRTTKLYDRRPDEISLHEGREDFDLNYGALTLEGNSPGLLVSPVALSRMQRRKTAASPEAYRIL